jgi:polyhydroxybutyrate depolymerase
MLRSIARLSTALLLAMLCLSTETSHAKSKVTFKKIEIKVGKLSRRAWYLAPENIVETRSYSLLFALHGGGGKAQSMAEISRLDHVYPDFEKSWIFVFPEGLDKHWNDARGSRNSDVDDLQYFDEVLSALQKIVKIDSRKIFATGISNGGMMSFRLACTKPWLRAFAPVAATMPASLKETCRPPSPRSMLLILGDRDPLVPYQGGDVTGPFGVRKLGKVLSAADSMSTWKELGHCTKKTISTPVLATPTDPTSLEGEKWSECTDSTSVELVKVVGGGHTWPGGEQYLREGIIGKTSRHLDATKRILEFFESLP